MTSSSTSPWLTSTSPSATACSAPTANRPTSRSSTVSPDASRTNALSRLGQQRLARAVQVVDQAVRDGELGGQTRSEEHTSELQSLMRISYAVFCLKKKTTHRHYNYHTYTTIQTNNHIQNTY